MSPLRFTPAVLLIAACAPTTPSPMPPATTSPAPAAGPEASARAFVGELAARRFSTATQRFGDRLREAMPEAKLRAVWASVEQAAGALRGIDKTSLEALRTVHVVLRFAKARRDLKVVFGATGQIDGLWIGPVHEDLVSSARTLVDKLAGGDFQGAAVDFDPTMLGALPPDKLGAVWRQVTAQVGAFEGIESVKVKPISGRHATFVTCRFAEAKLAAKVVFDGDARVVGLFFVSPEEAAAWQPPPYAHPERFVEREVEVSLGGGGPVLPGTLSLPKGAGPFPAAVLVHGSGPNDADETVGGTKVFKDLAWGLASGGVAVLRYVKRSRVSAAGIVGVKEEVLDAVHAAVELCRSTPEIDPRRMVVVGHSQGGELGPRIAAESPSLAGLVVLAGNTRPVQDLVVDQLTYLAKLRPNDPEAQKDVEAARAFKRKVEDPGLKPDEEVSFPGAKLKGAYLLSLRGYKPAEVAAGLTIPMLILQGDRDYQVTAPDLDGWRRALGKKPNVTIKQYPADNHLFIPGSGPSTPGEYDKPGHFDEEALRDIAAFISRLPSRK